MLASSMYFYFKAPLVVPADGDAMYRHLIEVSSRSLMNSNAGLKLRTRVLTIKFFDTTMSELSRETRNLPRQGNGQDASSRCPPSSSDPGPPGSSNVNPSAIPDASSFFAQLLLIG